MKIVVLVAYNNIIKEFFFNFIDFRGYWYSINVTDDIEES